MSVSEFDCMMFDWKPIEVFWFLKRDLDHDRLLGMAAQVGFSALYASEGGFDFPTLEDRYNDARYGGRDKVMCLWRNGLSKERMWMLRLIFRLCGVATFDSEKEAYEYLRGLTHDG